MQTISGRVDQKPYEERERGDLCNDNLSISSAEFLKPIYFYEGLWGWQRIRSLDCVVSVCVLKCQPVQSFS